MVHATQGTVEMLLQYWYKCVMLQDTDPPQKCWLDAWLLPWTHTYSVAGYMHDTHISSWARVISQGIKSTTQRLCVTPTLSTWDHAWCTGKPTEHRYMVHWEPHADAQAFIRTCWIFPGMIVVILPIRKFVSHYEYYCIVNHWVVVLLTYTMQTVCPHKQVAAI